MKKITLHNDLNFRLTKELVNAIYSSAYRLEATDVVINKANGRWADIELDADDGCIAWHYQVNV